MFKTDLTDSAEQMLADAKTWGGLGLLLVALGLVVAAIGLGTMLALQANEEPGQAMPSCHALKNLDDRVMCLDVMLERAKSHIRQGCGK